MRPEHVEYDVVDQHIGVITFQFRLPRAAGAPAAGDPADAHGAQLMRELDDAWQTAGADSRVRVIVLRGTGRHFFDPPAAGPPVQGGQAWQLRYARAWKSVPKPAVAAVQGRCAAGGALLCWPCDHVIAADDAEFCASEVRLAVGGTDPGPAPGGGGPGTLTAAEAQSLGLVTAVVPLAALHSATFALARSLGGAAGHDDEVPAVPAVSAVSAVPPIPIRPAEALEGGPGR